MYTYLWIIYIYVHVFIIYIYIRCSKCWSRVQLILTSFWSTCCQNDKGKRPWIMMTLSSAAWRQGWSEVGARLICFMLHLCWNLPSKYLKSFQLLIFRECTMSKEANTPLEHINHQRTPFEYNSLLANSFRNCFHLCWEGAAGLCNTGASCNLLGTWLSSSQQTFFSNRKNIYYWCMSQLLHFCQAGVYMYLLSAFEGSFHSSWTIICLHNHQKPTDAKMIDHIPLVITGFLSKNHQKSKSI